MKNIHNLILSVTAIFLVVSALWIDFKKSSTYLFSDEASYYSMAVSLAYDFNLSFEKSDLSRIYRIWHAGPQGIFLKKNRISLPYHITDGPWKWISFKMKENGAEISNFYVEKQSRDELIIKSRTRSGTVIKNPVFERLQDNALLLHTKNTFDLEKYSYSLETAYFMETPGTFHINMMIDQGQEQQLNINLMNFTSPVPGEFKQENIINEQLTRIPGIKNLNTIYYAKSYIYPLFCIPFIIIFKVNGFLIFNALLLWFSIFLSYHYLKTEQNSGMCLIWVLTFYLFSTTYVYRYWIHPEMFNVCLLVISLYFWFRVTDKWEESGSFPGYLPAFRSTLLPVIIVGILTYSKITSAVYMIPFFLLPSDQV